MTAKLEEKDMKTRTFSQEKRLICIMDSPSKEEAQGHDMWVLLTDTLCFIVNSLKDKSTVFNKHILKDLAPRHFDARISEIQDEKHQG